MLKNFLVPGKASFLCGGQWGSEAKGAAAAWVGTQTKFDIMTSNASAQAGHTSIHGGKKRVVFHLPSAQFGNPDHWPIGYCNAGCAIDPVGLHIEMEKYGNTLSEFYIHPNAAIITQACRDAEGRADSAQTAIASTRKGVGEALSRKVLRSGVVARDYKARALGELGYLWMAPFIRRLDLNSRLLGGKSVLVEVPQGLGLGVNGKFYPHCTSRDCGPAQAANDAGIHHSLCGPVMLVLRTFPIRVGNIINEVMDRQPLHIRDIEIDKQLSGTSPVGFSGGCYPDQHEIAWSLLGVEPEITTVTKRVRRVFTWSQQQVIDAMTAARPAHVFLSHVDYLENQPHKLDWYVDKIRAAAATVSLDRPQIFFSTGPTTADVHEVE